MDETAKLLTPAHNFAVVQLPARQHPGVVFQGDALHAMVLQITEMKRQLAAGEFDGLADELRSLLEDISSIRQRYERVCLEQGLSLPYAR